MKILFVVHQFFPDSQGHVERTTLDLALQLSRMGHPATVLSSSRREPRSGEAPEEYGYEGLRVITCEPSRLIEPMRDEQRDPAAEAMIGGVLDEVRPDVVHCMHPGSLPEARSVAAGRGIAVFVHVHDYWHTCPRSILIRPDGALCTGAREGANCETYCGLAEGVGTARMEWARQELALTAGVFYTSVFLRDVYASQGFDPQGWHWIPHGVDYNILRPAPSLTGSEPARTLKVRFLGQLAPHEGGHVLLEAAEKVDSVSLEFALHCPESGDLEYGVRLRTRAQRDGRIVFAGPWDHSALGEILSDTAVLVVPSLWYESWPLVPAAAIAAGVPIIASDLGGLREMVRRYRAGHLFPAGDSAALGRLLSGIAENPDSLTEIRGGMLHPPSIEEEAHRIELVYRDALA